jgi:DHA1 family tetracycline resistance protein-like MFS transporter
VGRVISGVTSASFGTAGAYIADVTPAEQRAARFGMLGAAFGFGFVVGPAVGGLLGGIGLRLPFWVAGGLSLANAAYGLFILPESLPKERRSRFEWSKANPVGSLKLLGASPELVVLAAATFLMELAHQSLPSVFVLYADYRYGWSESEIGLALALVGVTSTIVSAALVGPMVAKMGERVSLVVGLLFFAGAFATYGLAPTGAWLLAGIPFGSLGGLASPAMQGLMTRHASSSDQGKLQGALGSLAGITGLIGPLLFTQTFAAAIRATGALHVPGAPYLVAALLSTLALVVSVGFFARSRPKGEALPAP